VGAAINPVLGACLARVVRTGPAASVFDPTCGSATLLIERALLDPQTSLVGLDISPTACAAATTNIVAAGFQARIAVSRGDAADPSTWPICDEVLANLPFGLRTAREDADLEALYRDLLGNLVKQLRSGGRALLYTSHRDLLQPLLEAHIDKLELRRRFRVRSGGLWVDAWLLEAR
jgi:23S rRNA G2445 N2-methylase RlmL